jgi:uncharacterized protein YyaL (SSP411 family)
MLRHRRKPDGFTPAARDSPPYLATGPKIQTTRNFAPVLNRAYGNVALHYKSRSSPDMNKQNHLAGQTSPYLLQHIENPVDWYPWGEEAFAKARAEDKPIFLSVGYSACHWCHVMAHESFEHDEVAEILNAHFVSIKLDREEFPDLDHLYMTATSLMTGRGGWPNSVWLLPDGRPWYAGTYFPREDQLDRMGFKSLLMRLNQLWKEQRSKVEEQAAALVDAIRQNNAVRNDPALESWTVADWAGHAQQHFRNQFDSLHGGFGEAPKFPPHSGLNMLLTSLDVAPNEETSTIIQSTLDAMIRGGIHDHLGGGFHRYATDERWHLPHFEKMLYDNALLMKAYARAAVRFGRNEYRDVVLDIAAWLSREMTHPEGGFYAALDADSEGEEGLFYTWTHHELKDLVPASHYEAFCDFYQILPGGNFHDEASGRITGRNILHASRSPTPEESVVFNQIRQTLLNARSTRVRPGCDIKIITAWNGLMISALAVAGHELSDPSLVSLAEQARMFLTNHLQIEGRPARCWAGNISVQRGRLDDYASLAVADLDLYEATNNQQHLSSASALVQDMLEEFYDPVTGELFMAHAGDAVAGLRVKDIYDQGSPSGSGLALQAIMRLGTLTQNESLIETGRKITATMNQLLHKMPSMTSSAIEGTLLAEPAAL